MLSGLFTLYMSTSLSFIFQEDNKCRFKKDKIGAVVVGYTGVESGNEQKLMEAVATVGPISVAIDASHISFKHFHGGKIDLHLQSKLFKCSKN